MSHFESFNTGYEKLQLNEADYYAKLIFLELEHLKAERLREYINGDIPLNGVWPTERDIRSALDATHKKLKHVMEKTKASLPWNRVVEAPVHSPEWENVSTLPKKKP